MQTMSYIVVKGRPKRLSISFVLEKGEGTCVTYCSVRCCCQPVSTVNSRSRKALHTHNQSDRVCTLEPGASLTVHVGLVILWSWIYPQAESGI